MKLSCRVAHQLNCDGTMKTKTASLVFIVVIACLACVLAWTSESVPGPRSRASVLVELFTSEGCSSCPPADRFLESLDLQPLPGAELIVLSEHVDYWNDGGWKDPYSARSYSERQAAYARRFGLGSVYTPEMVVDGTSEFVGSSSRLAEQAFGKAARVPKIPVRLSAVSINAPNSVRAHLETGALDSALGSAKAEVYAAVALNHAESQVSAGENAGHKLTHVSVVRSVTKIGELKKGQSLSQDVQLKLAPATDNRNLRLIIFVQQPGQGRVLGAAALPVPVP